MRLTAHRRHDTAAAHQDPANTAHDRDGSPRATGPRDAAPAEPPTAWPRRLLLAGFVGLAVVVLVAPATAVADPVHTVALAGSVGTVLDNVRNWIMGVLAGLATVFLTIGGVRYVMAGGDPGEVQKAKIAFKSAGIGYGLAALAPLVVTVLKGIVGA
jgi:hypothetical protein